MSQLIAFMDEGDTFDGEFHPGIQYKQRTDRGVRILLPIIAFIKQGEYRIAISVYFGSDEEFWSSNSIYVGNNWLYLA